MKKSMKRKTAVLLTVALSVLGAGSCMAEPLTEGTVFENAETKLVYQGFAVENNYDGQPIVELLFDYTNYREEANCASLDYYVEVYQNGIALDIAFPLTNSISYKAYSDSAKNIKDGASLSVCYCYELQDTSEIELSIKELSSFEEIGSDLTIDLSEQSANVAVDVETNTEATESSAGEDQESKITELEAKIEEQNQLIAKLQQELEDANAKIIELEGGTSDIAQNEAKEEQAVTGTITLGEQNALSKAVSYLSMMSFSYSGLIKQLEFEGYSTEEATYAADNCEADWKEQAAKKAKAYIEIMSFSRDGLIDQLEFDGFTSEQAEYGVTAVGY